MNQTMWILSDADSFLPLICVQWKHEKKEKKIFVHTSDNDRTGGLTQSSQHFDKTVSKTIGGETPSHLVRSCSWRRFNWQNISVRNAMNAVNLGRAVFLTFCAGPRTLSRSWYHWRHVFNSASK